MRGLNINRFVIKDEASPWSQPINFNVAANPEKPIIYSFQIVPSRINGTVTADDDEIFKHITKIH